jgi:hypothetical protein
VVRPRFCPSCEDKESGRQASLGQPDKTPATLPADYPDGLYGEKEPGLADGQLKSAAEQPATYVDNDFGKGSAGLRARPDYGEEGSKETITPAMVDGPDPKTASIPGIITPMAEFGKGEGVAKTLAEAVPGVGTAPNAVLPAKFAGLILAASDNQDLSSDVEQTTAERTAAVGEAHQVDEWTKVYGKPAEHTTGGSTTTQTDTVMDFAHPSQGVNDEPSGSDPDADGAGQSGGDMGGGTVTASAAPGPWVVIDEATGKVKQECTNKGEATKVYNKLNAAYSAGDKDAPHYSMEAKSHHEEMKPKTAAVAPETVNAVRHFIEHFGGQYLPLKALQAELSRLTTDVKGALSFLKMEGMIEPYEGGVKVLNRDLAADQQVRTPGLPTAMRGSYVIRNASGQHWACADVAGVKLGGFWTDDAAQEAHEFQNPEEAHEEVRRNCLDREDGAIVLPKGIGPLKLAGWWSPGALLAKAYPQLAGVAQHVPGSRKQSAKSKPKGKGDGRKPKPKKAESWWDTGQVADQFAPQLMDNASPNFQGELGQQEPEGLLNPFGAPGNGEEQAPVSLAGCPEGMNKEYDGVPLKQETNFYGPEFMREFYAPQTGDIPADELTVKQSAWKKAKAVKLAQPGDPVPPQPQLKPKQPSVLDALNLAAPEEQPKTPYIDPQQNGDGVDNPGPAYLMIDKLVKGVMGAYVSQLIGAFNYTRRPLELETPFEDKINLEEVLAYGGESSETASKAAQKQLSHALDLLSDDEKKQVVNDGQAQAAVWCESETGAGGYTYEVFARVEAIEGAVLTVRAVTGIR